MAPRKKTPTVNTQAKDPPETTAENKELPIVGAPENTVKIGEKLIEIKSTKLKYQRNKTALFYKALGMFPIADIMGMEAGTFGDERDGDQCIFEFLIAATDDEALIRENYDEMDTETIERILSIFRRVNKIDEKEAKQKNAAAPMMEA